ncbi:hypothetical protein BR93DRAFT_930086 [Coniochaeta sp. PMI_546]|nr:hypothetical protein BR93DRAFT_930086 [Coniochaeta sp. PMI_546]
MCSIVTETATAIKNGVATALFTETDTETVSTEVLLYTESTTVTASTETDILTESTTVTASTKTDILTQTATVPVTTTAVQTAAAVTSTSTVYQVAAKARRSASANLPVYASTVCPSWDKYVSACKCAGAVATTITVPAPAVTVTVPAGSTVTSVVSTLSSTETDIVSAVATVSSTESDISSVTATTLSTETDSILLTATVSTTQIDIVSSTSIASQTSTPTTVVTLTCKPPGTAFQVTSPYTDGTTRFMNVISSGPVAWQTTSIPVGTGGASTYSYTWTLDSNGYLELAHLVGTGTTISVPYIDLSVTTSSVSITTKPKAVVEAAVAAGTYARLKGCVNAATNEVTISGAGRSNILLCGNLFYLSSGTGSDVSFPCTRLFPTGTQVS